MGEGGRRKKKGVVCVCDSWNFGLHIAASWKLKRERVFIFFLGILFESRFSLFESLTHGDA